MAPHQLSFGSKCLTTDSPNTTHSISNERIFHFSSYIFNGCFKTESTDNSKEINPIRHLELLIDEVTIHIFHLKISVTLIYTQL